MNVCRDAGPPKPPVLLPHRFRGTGARGARGSEAREAIKIVLVHTEWQWKACYEYTSELITITFVARRT